MLCICDAFAGLSLHLKAVSVFYAL